MQQTLFNALELPRNQREARFLDFHKNNPQVYDLWCFFTTEVLNTGRTKIGSRVIAERIRWETNLNYEGREIKFNDHYIPYYARLWMKDNPKHNNLFRTKSIEGE